MKGVARHEPQYEGGVLDLGSRTVVYVESSLSNDGKLRRVNRTAFNAGAALQLDLFRPSSDSFHSS